MPTPRVLLGMTLGAVVAALGALFLGEYEFDEWLPIVAGALLGLIAAEVVVSVGKQQSLTLAVMVATWAATAVVLAGMLDANETEPIKVGAYLSAALAALAALARVNQWRKPKAAGPSDVARSDAGRSDAAPSSGKPRRPSTSGERTKPAPKGTIVPSRGTEHDERDDRSVRTRGSGAGPTSARPQPRRSPQPAPGRNPSAGRRPSPDDGRGRSPRPRPAPEAPIADEEWMEQPAPPRIPSAPARVRASVRRLQPSDQDGPEPGERRRPRGDDEAPVREPAPRSRRTDRGR